MICKLLNKLVTPSRAWVTSQKQPHAAQSGFVMPTVMFLMIIMSFVAYAALLQSNNSLNLAYKQAYIQMARSASKAAVDYAQEQFDNASCGSYSGTAEQDLVSNSRYRLTFRAEVLDTSADGYEKTIKGTGSIYLPKNSATAQYVFDIRSEIVRTYALCKTPDNFNPTLWLDASDTETLKKTAVSSSSSAGTVGLGILDLFLPNDTVEEKVTNGTQGILSWLSNDLDMHTCSTNEYTLLACNGSQANRALYTGIVFQNITIPRNATITSATLKFSGATPSGSGGSVTHQLYGLYDTASNPHLGLFVPLGTNQIGSRITNSNLRTNTSHSQSTNNFPPGNTLNFDVTSVVQEMVQNPNWDSASNGGRIGFGLQRTAGNGSRSACKGNPTTGSCAGKGPQLTVSYTTGSSVSQADNGEGVNEWQDKSGNNNHARSTYGAIPTRQDNQINTRTVVRFNNGVMLSSLLPTINEQREMTVLAVVKANFASSASDGRIISGTTNTTPNDTNGGSTIIPLLRNSTNMGFSSVYASLVAGNRTDANCNSDCSSMPFVYSSTFATIDDNNTSSSLKGNGSLLQSRDNISPSVATPPYRYSINQIYIGGTRTGLSPGSGANYLNGDYAEIIVYDHALTCRQQEAIEEYLRVKWNTTPLQSETICPADLVPTL